MGRIRGNGGVKGVMRAARDNRRIVTLLALALAVAATSLPASAQSGSEAVVCVGSERRTLATNPIRRVYTEDMEIVYRIGADISQRDQIERDLSSELGSYPEVWCAWSDPGDNHAVIISYTGVIRQDLTVDPEDPRFQAFSVGFGTGFDAAEMQATTINQRFSSQSDGSGYEVLLRETWSVAEGVVEAVSVPEPSRPDGPICTGRASSEGCWAAISNHPGCYLWNPGPREGFSANWSGECVQGFAEGRGEVTWRWNDGSATDSGLLRGGRREGFHVIDWSNGERYEGSYVNDKRQGTWTFIWEDGARDVGPYVNGEQHGNWAISFGDGSRGEGPYVHGEMHGTWTIVHEGRSDDLVREVGPYVNGERHGTWTGYDQSGNRLGTVRFENGRRVGGSGSALEAGATATVAPLHLGSPAAWTLECELLDRVRFRTAADARREVFSFIAGFYNTRRLHSALGYQAPANFEELNRAACAEPGPERPTARALSHPRGRGQPSLLTHHRPQESTVREGGAGPKI